MPIPEIEQPDTDDTQTTDPVAAGFLEQHAPDASTTRFQGWTTGLRAGHLPAYFVGRGAEIEAVIPLGQLPDEGPRMDKLFLLANHGLVAGGGFAANADGWVFLRTIFHPDSPSDAAAFLKTWADCPRWSALLQGDPASGRPNPPEVFSSLALLV